MFFNFKRHWPLLISIFVYLTFVLLIRPWGEFAVNDDWDFFLHVREFAEGNFVKNSLIDSTFILQGLLALGWVKIFGLSYTALRVLTIIITIIATAGLYKIFRLYAIKDSVIAVLLLTFLFNPFVLYSSLSFMTENYFITFMLWGIYFYLRYLKFPTLKYISIAAAIFAGSLLIRQFGVICFIALLLHLILLVVAQKASRKIHVKSFAISCAFFALSYGIAHFWPQYLGDHDERMANFFLSGEDTIKFLTRAYQSIPYFVLFLSPLIGFLPKVKRHFFFTAILAIFSLYVTGIFFENDIFALGNVFHIEGILIRDEITIDVSLFNTIVFKYLLAFYLASIFVKVIWHYLHSSGTILNIKDNLSKPEDFLLILAGGLFFSMLVAESTFDRYLVNVFVILLIIFAIKVDHIEFSRQNVLPVLSATAILILISGAVTAEFYTVSKLKWAIAKKISERTKVVRGIYVSSPYLKYTHVTRYDSFSDIKGRYPKSPQYSCFVQSYVEKTRSPLISWLSLTGSKLEIENPRIVENVEKPFPKIESNKGNLLYSEPYYSLHKNLLGMQSYVGGFCLKNVKVAEENSD